MLLRIHIPLPRGADVWLPGYLSARWRQMREETPRRVWLMFADHFEPLTRGADEKTARARVELWRQRWPQIAARHRDSSGRPPKYTFFYPQETYRPELLEMLAEMTEAGIADVEIHIHHDGEGERNFVGRMRDFLSVLHHRHGLLRKHDGKIVFGFIHGNWALDNSLPNGHWCGLNNEITLLRDLGCYADFTMPSAPSPSQSRMVNTIYWATDDPQRPKSYDVGVPVKADGVAQGDLLMIPGPLGLNWRERRRRLPVPNVEIGELAGSDPPTRHRARLWLRYSPRIGGDVFIKLFTHGAPEKNSAMLLNGGLDFALESLQSECTAEGYDLRFASAWEMRQAVGSIRLKRGPDSEGRKNEEAALAESVLSDKA